MLHAMKDNVETWWKENIGWSMRVPETNRAIFFFYNIIKQYILFYSIELNNWYKDKDQVIGQLKQLLKGKG